VSFARSPLDRPQSSSAFGDESLYARASLELFRTLLRSPVAWMHGLLDVYPTKPNGLIWVGQFFVPVGYLMGSVDKGLLLSVWITQLLIN
jgi:hypothetical protein